MYRIYFMCFLVITACGDGRQTPETQLEKPTQQSAVLTDDDLIGAWEFYWDEKLKKPIDTVEFMPNGTFKVRHNYPRMDKPTKYSFKAESKELLITEYKRGRVNKELYKAEWHGRGVVKISTFYPGDRGAGFYLKKLRRY